MTVHYGVLRGQVDIFKRENDNSSPHLQIRILGGGKKWRAAVNVLSGDKSRVIFHRVDPLLNHPILDGLSQLASGFTPIPAGTGTASNALDYFRAPLFDWPTGIAIPHTGPGANDDLQDVMTTYLGQLRDQGGEIFVFGSIFPAPGSPPDRRPIDNEFDTDQGIHDVHMNQGNPNPGQFAGDNGVFHDGGIILKFGTRFVGLFLRFQTEWLPTDNATGHRRPDAQPIPAGGSIGGGGGVTPTPVSHPNIYIERALVNPASGDVGKEVVVLGNATTQSVNLAGWRIVDKNNRAENLQGIVLPGGESRLVVLSGNGAQLSNDGGTITLRNQAGEQVHAVSYAKADAKEGIYIRFTT